MKHLDSRTRRWSLLWAFGAFGLSASAQTPVKPAHSFAGVAPPSQSASSDASARARVSDQRIHFWQQKVSEDPDYFSSYNNLAAAYTQKARETGDISYFELAEGSLKKSLDLESKHVEAAPAFTQLAAVHLAEHRFSEAGDDATKAIALLPEDLAAYPCAGDAQLELGNYTESQAFYDHLIAPPDDMIHPGIQFLATSHGAGLHWIKGDTAQATKDLEHATDLARQMHMPDENIAWTQFMLGEQFFQAGDLATAEREETAALTSFPRYHRALAAMGQIRAAQGRYPESIAFYKDAVSIIPLPLYLAAFGDVYTAAGDKANAEKQYAVVEFIGKLNAINQQVYNRELALFYADHNRKLPEALTLARKELEVRHDIYTSDAIAWALLKNNQPQAAQIEIEKALRLNTPDAMLHFHAGMIYAALGDKSQAVAHLQRALAISPHFHVLYAPQAVATLATLNATAVEAEVSDATQK